ncbi:MAG: RNA polymerase sigma factor [Deltaproteobacteria bacterium]
MPHGATPGKSLTPESLYQSEGQYVWNSLRRLGVRDADLEDLTHEVFIVALRRLPSYDPLRPIRPWLFGIATRVAGHQRRWWRRRGETLGELPDVEDPGPPPDEALADREQRALLIRALGRIKLERRAVLILHELDEVAIPEIARALSIPLNTAYSRLRIGRAELVAAVRRLEGRR